MTTEHLKKAAKTPQSESGTARAVASEMLADIEARGEAAVREYAAKLDGWSGDIIVSSAEIERRTRDIPSAIKRDIEFATERVRAFAALQRDSIREFAIELHRASSPGSASCPSTSPAATCRPGATRTSRPPT